MDAKIEVFGLKREADIAVDEYKRLGFPNILVMGPLDLIEGAEMGGEGWLVLVTHAEVLATGSGGQA